MATATEAPASVTAEGPTSHTQNQADTRPANTFGYSRAEQLEALHRLREPFKPEEIRYLPRVWCKACRDAKGTCSRNDHERRQCRKCGQNMTTAHIDLRFVGHAEATNRLLNVDPFWDWEPMAPDANGLPQYDGNRGMWIRLTVCGMTRLGYGSADGKSGGDAVKEIIGDAIRNAGMRFGMALDLWTSSDLEIVESGGASLDETAAGPAQEARPETSGPRAMTPAETQQQILGPFLERVRNGWDSLEATLQALAEAKAKTLLNEMVPFGEPKVPTRVEDMLAARITHLRARRDELNSNADTRERNAA
ncbi:hypothetical protein [Streptomyces californicus]|uniref:hypothetical protein n=1 Tax=Streptomyces californicus TaxID=67351 RepID=UPI00067B8739|nr:hypothetical protein [Streptomyces californicus]QRV59396.1 hypothetical protein I6J40_34625 [Streptomyces californicus]